MAEKTKSVLVVCVDRDDDFGRKAGIEGPIIGKKANLNAAAKLALADPEDSDSNTVFAAVKKMQEAKKLYANVEVVTLTGAGKFEIDLVNLFNKKRPLIYKVEEGKYIIDLASTLQQNVKDLKEIKNPDEKN